jgi:hypothetical protein
MARGTDTSEYMSEAITSHPPFPALVLTNLYNVKGLRAEEVIPLCRHRKALCFGDWKSPTIEYDAIKSDFRQTKDERTLAKRSTCDTLLVTGECEA